MINKSTLLILIALILCGCSKNVSQPPNNIFALRHDKISSELVVLVVPNYKMESVVLFGVTAYDINQSAKSIIYSTLSYSYEQLVIIPKGKNEQLLTDVKKYLRNPHISPDGKKIVLEARDDITDKSQIMILDIDSVQMDSLFDNNSFGTFPRWSNDGKFVSFLTPINTCPSDFLNQCFNLSIVSIDTRKIVKSILGPINYYYPVSWSANSDEIVFSRWANGSYELVTYNLKENTELKIENTGTNDIMGVWSDTGDQLAFSRSVKNNQNSSEICIAEKTKLNCLGQDLNLIIGILWIDDHTVLFGFYDKSNDSTTIKILDVKNFKNIDIGTFVGYFDNFQTLK